MRIVLSGIILENNFGLPSILHGYENVLSKLGHEITYIQSPKWDESKLYDYRSIHLMNGPYNPRKLLVYACLKKVHIRLNKNNKEFELIDFLSTQECIIDAYGICFCDAFAREGRVSLLRCAKDTFGNYVIPVCGKILGKKTIKGVTTFGPMDKLYSKRCASFASKYIFDVLIAREKKSYDAIKKVSPKNKKILQSPDVATWMAVPENEKRRGVVISVSHQIIRQWKGKSGYINLMTSFCEYIHKSITSQITLLPNEVHEGYNDISVANDIKDVLLKKNIHVFIPDVKMMSSTEIKSIISNAEVAVSSRYHSCVAALSSNVPLLVIGWHDKYSELMKYYRQSEYIIPSENCTEELLIEQFRKLWSNKESIKNDLGVTNLYVKELVEVCMEEAIDS